jgi:hypothetical protein
LQAGKTTLWTLALLAAAALAACGPDAHDAANTPANAAAPGEQGFQPAPELTAAAPEPAGGVDLVGKAPAGAVVRVASPTGAALFATADDKGEWRIALPAAAQPRLLGLSMSAGGRVVEAMGYLFVAPDGVVARLRAGGGSEVLAARAPGMVALALDYDTRKAATLSGAADAGEAEILRVDGVERGEATADNAGRFVLLLNEPLTAGSHDFDLAGAKTEVRFTASIGAAAQLANAPFVAGPVAQGWRIDWITPGGGEQTTLVLDALAPAA